MRDKMAISAQIFEKSLKGPIFEASNWKSGYFQLMGCSRFYLKYIYLSKVFQEMRQIVRVVFG